MGRCASHLRAGITTSTTVPRLRPRARTEAVVAELPARCRDGVGRVVDRVAGASVAVPRGWRTVAHVELHGSRTAPETVDARPDSRSARAAVVGLDLADPGQQLPRQL